MKILKVLPEDWATYSEDAHVAVFGVKKPAAWDRLSFALLAIENDTPVGYVTCQERTHEMLYWQFGGSFPGARGGVLAWTAWKGFLDWAIHSGYKYVTFQVANTNQAMLKMAMKSGFKISGVRAWGQYTLLEHVLEISSNSDSRPIPESGDLQITVYDKKRHWLVLEAWWEARGFPSADPALLPPTGRVALFQGNPIAAAFLFKTDAKSATIGNLVSDPLSTKSDRSDAIDLLLLTLAEIAEDEGFLMVAAATNHPGLVTRYEKLGWTAFDQGVTHLARRL